MFNYNTGVIMSSVKSFREALIFVAGATPQIITETIYALAMQNPPVYVDELCIITHSYGKKLIQQKLVNEGILQQLCREYGISEQTFYNWKAKYGGMTVRELKRLKELEAENARLKKMFADISLENYALKDLISKKL